MDKLYRVVIIDDDEFSADNLCLELKKYNRLSIDGMARNGANGRKLLEKVHPDLLFLDVELPDMKGMELLEQLRGAITWNMQIVFYTAYDKLSPIVVYFTALVSRCSFLFIILSFGRMPNTISMRSFSVILLSDRHAMRMSFTISTLFIISSR